MCCAQTRKMHEGRGSSEVDINGQSIMLPNTTTPASLERGRERHNSWHLEIGWCPIYLIWALAIAFATALHVAYTVDYFNWLCSRISSPASVVLVCCSHVYWTYLFEIARRKCSTGAGMTAFSYDTIPAPF